MKCPSCNLEGKKFGFFGRTIRIQRYRCHVCKRTFGDIPQRPLDSLRIPTDKGVQILHLLVEGVGIRAIERLTGIHRDRVLSILEVAGKKCARLLDEKVRNVNCEFVQTDELHTFVGCKAQNTTARDKERGDFFTYLSVDRNSKLIINWRSCKRTRNTTLEVMEDLQSRMASRFQLTTDGYAGYCGYSGTVREVFGNTIDYATETKVYGKLHPDRPIRFNPLTVLSVERKARLGKPNMRKATTCHVERTNLSVRTFTRRFTRCTIGYSKKKENLRYQVALFVAHFNFCRVHSTISKTPAMEAGLASHVWSIEELLTPSFQQSTLAA